MGNARLEHILVAVKIVILFIDISDFATVYGMFANVINKTCNDMEEKTLQILTKVKNGKLTPKIAQEQLFVLFGVSGCFTIGARIQITHCIHGHEYEIGEVVTIIDHKPDERTSWLCESKNGQWYICEDEGVPVNNR